MLKLRVLTVAILLPAFAACAFYLPASWWAALMFVITLIAAGEWARLAGFDRICSGVFYLCIVLGCALAFVRADLERPLFFASVAGWAVAVPLILWRKPSMRNTGIGMLTGFLALVPMWVATLRLQHDPALMLALLAVVWISDSAAYAAGHAFGRHKLAPRISPGKTWEGVFGAFAGVAVYAAVFRFWWYPATEFHYVLIAFFALTVLGILGDLFESLLKRNAGVKDSGTLLPGHGGVLDRIDALTAAMPLAALLFGKP